MAVYHDPDLRIPRRPLAPHRIYHFNVIYNHGTGSDTGDQTSDMELALRVTRALVSRLEMKGYVNSYYHHRDFGRPNKLETELDRVLRGSSVTVLILTPDFLPKCRQLYLRSNLFSSLIGEPRTRRRLLNLSVGVSRSQVPPELTPDDVLYFGCDWELDIPVWDRIEDIVETISDCSYDHLCEDYQTYDDLNVTTADFSVDHQFLSYETSTSPCRGDNYLGEDQTWQTSVDTSTGFVPLDLENDNLECEDSLKEDYYDRPPSLSVSRDELNQWCYGIGNQFIAKTFSDERNKIIGLRDALPSVSRVYDIHGTLEIVDCSHSEKSTKHAYKTLEQRPNRVSDCLCSRCIETDLEPSIRDENLKSRDINACHRQSYRNRSHFRPRHKQEFSESLSSEWSACEKSLHTTDNDFNHSSFKSPSADHSKRGHSIQRTLEASVEHTGNLKDERSEDLNRWTSADKWTKWTQDLTDETSPITLSTEKPIVDFNNPIPSQAAEKKTYLGKNYETMHLSHSTFDVKRTHDKNNTSNKDLINSTSKTSLPHETDKLHTDTDYSLDESKYTSSYNRQFLTRRTCDSLHDKFNISSLDSPLGLMGSSSSRPSLLFEDLNLVSTESNAPVSPRGVAPSFKFRSFEPATALRDEQQTTRGFEDSCYNYRSCSSVRNPARTSAGKYREGKVPILRGTNAVRLSRVMTPVGDSQYKTDYQQDKYSSPLSESRIHKPSRSALSETNWSSESPNYLFREFNNADWTRHHNQSSTDSSNSQGYLPFCSTDTLPNRYHDYSLNDYYETYKDFQVPNRNVGTSPATQKTKWNDFPYSTKSDGVIESKGTLREAWLDSDYNSMNRQPSPNSSKTFTLENLEDQDTSSRLPVWDNVDITFERKQSFTMEYENQVLKEDEPMCSERTFNENSEPIAEAATSLTSPASRDFNENKTFVGLTDTDFTKGDNFSLYESEDRVTWPSRHLSNPALGFWQAGNSMTQMHEDKTERDIGRTYTIYEETSQISTVNSSSAALNEFEPTSQYENKTYSETELHHRGIMQYVQTYSDDKHFRDENTDFVIENNPLPFPKSQDNYWTLEQSQDSSQLPRIESPKHQYLYQHDTSTRQSDHTNANKPMENIVASNISQDMQLEPFLKTLSIPIIYKQGQDQTNTSQKRHDNYQLNFTQFGVDSIILENTCKPIHVTSTQIESTTNEALDPDNQIQTLLGPNNGLSLSGDNPNCTYSVHVEGTDLESKINTIDIGDVQHGSMNPVPPGNDFYVKMNRKEWCRATTESTFNNEAHQNKNNSMGKRTESNLSCFNDTSMTSTGIISENVSKVSREEIIGTIKSNPHITIDHIGLPLGLSHSINHQVDLETKNEVSKELSEGMAHDVDLVIYQEFVSTEAIHCDVSTDLRDKDRRHIEETNSLTLKENQDLDKSVQKPHQDGTILEDYNYGTTLSHYNEREEVTLENIKCDYLIAENGKTETSEWNIRDNLTREERHNNLTTEESTHDKLILKERSRDFVTSKNNIAIPKDSNCHLVRLEDISSDILLSESYLDKVIVRDSNNDNTMTENKDETLSKNNINTATVSIQNGKREIVTNEHISHGVVSNEHISHGVVSNEHTTHSFVTPSRPMRSSTTMTSQQQTGHREPIVEATGQSSELFNFVKTQNIHTDTALREGTEKAAREINVDMKNFDRESGETNDTFQNFVTVQTIPLDGLEIKHLTNLVCDTDATFSVLNFEPMDQTRSNSYNEAVLDKGCKNGQTSQDGLVNDGFCHITSGEKEMNVSSLKEENFILDTLEDEELKASTQSSEHMNRQSFHEGQVNSLKEETLNQSTLPNDEFTGSDKHTETKQGSQKEEEINQDNLKGNEINQDNLKGDEINQDNLKENDNQDNLKKNEMNQDNLKGNEINQNNLKGDKINQDYLKGDEMNQDYLKGNEINQNNLKGDEINQDNLKGDEINQDNLRDNEINQDNVKGDEINQDNLRDNEINKDNLKTKEHNHDDKKDKVIHQNSLKDEVIHRNSLKDEEINEDSLKEDEIDKVSLKGNTNYQNRQTDKVIYQGEINHDGVMDENIQNNKIMDKNIQHDSIKDENIQHVNATDENIQHDSITDENIQHENITEENIQHDSATNENIQQDNITDENIHHNNTKDENIQHDSATNENIQQDSITDENIHHDNTKDENIQHDSATDQNIQKDITKDENIQNDITKDNNIHQDSITDENIQHESLISEIIDIVNKTEAQVNYYKSSTKVVDSACIVVESAQTNRDCVEINDKNNYQEIVKKEEFNKEIKNSDIEKKIFQHQYLKDNQDIDTKVDQKIVEIKDADGDKEIKEIKVAAIDFDVVKINDAEINQEIIEANDAEINQEIIEANDAEINQEIIEAYDAEGNQEIIDVNDADINQEIIDVNDADINQEIIEVKDAEVNQKIIEVIDADINQEIIEVKDADINQEIIEVKDAEDNQEIIYVNDAEANQEIIEVKDAEVNQEIIEVKDAEVNQEIIEVKDADVNQEIIEVKDAEVNQEIIEVKDAEVNQEIIDVNDADINQEIIEVKDADVNQEIIKVKDAEVNQEIIDVNDADINQEIIEVKDAEVNQEIIDVNDEDINQEIIEVKDAEVNQEIIEVKDADVNQEIIEVKDAEVNQEIIEVKDAEDNQEIIEVKDADVNQEIIDIKNADINQEIIEANDEDINLEIIEVKDAEDNQEIFEVKDAEVNQEIIEVKDGEDNQEIIEVKDADVNQEIIDIKNADINQEIIEANDEDINQEIIEVKDAEVNQEIIEVKDAEVNQEIIDVNDADINQEIIEVKDADVNQEIIEVKDAEVNQEIIDVNDADINQEIIAVKDAEVNQEIIDVNDADINQEIIEVKDAEVNQEIIEVKDADVNQEIIEIKDVEVNQEIIEVKDAKVNQEIINIKDAEVNQEIIEVKDAVVHQDFVKEKEQVIIEIKNAELYQKTDELKVAGDHNTAEIKDEDINHNDNFEQNHTTKTIINQNYKMTVINKDNTEPNQDISIEDDLNQNYLSVEETAVTKLTSSSHQPQEENNYQNFISETMYQEIDATDKVMTSQENDILNDMAFSEKDIVDGDSQCNSNENTSEVKVSVNLIPSEVSLNIETTAAQSSNNLEKQLNVIENIITESVQSLTRDWHDASETSMHSKQNKHNTKADSLESTSYLLQDQSNTEAGAVTGLTADKFMQFNSAIQESFCDCSHSFNKTAHIFEDTDTPSQASQISIESNMQEYSEKDDIVFQSHFKEQVTLSVNKDALQEANESDSLSLKKDKLKETDESDSLLVNKDTLQVTKNISLEEKKIKRTYPLEESETQFKSFHSEQKILNDKQIQTDPNTDITHTKTERESSTQTDQADGFGDEIQLDHLVVSSSQLSQGPLSTETLQLDNIDGNADQWSDKDKAGLDAVSYTSSGVDEDMCAGNVQDTNQNDSTEKCRATNWILPVYRGVCHSVTNPEMPFMG